MIDWSSGTFGASVVAIVISVAGLVYTRRVDQRQARAEQPTVSVDLTDTGWPGWYAVLVRVRNRTDAVWVLEAIDVPHWESARIGRRDDVIENPLYADGPISPQRDRAQVAPVRMDERVSPLRAGEAGACDAHFLLSIERGLGSHSVLLAVRLRSLAETRTINLMFQRVSPSEAAAKTSAT